MTKNRLYFDDNLEVLATMEKESVDPIWMTKKGAFLVVFFVDLCLKMCYNARMLACPLGASRQT